MKLITSLIEKFMYGVALTVLLLIGAFFALPHVPGFGALDVKIVKSGSMEPTINTGGVVLIREVGEYREGDIITFTSAGTEIPTTHRITGTEVVPDGGTYFVTKGDANEERDTELVPQNDIIGKVLLDVPYVGFILDFARQPIGFALLVGIPAFIIILDEIEKIWKTLRARREDDGEGDGTDADASHSPRNSDQKTVYTPLVIPPLPEPRRVVMHDMFPRQRETVSLSLREQFAYETHVARKQSLSFGTIIAFIVGGSLILHPFGGTVAFYRNVETSLQNVLMAETIDFTVTGDGTLFVFTDGVIDDPDGALMVLASPTGESSLLRFDVRAEYATGSASLCDALLSTVTGGATSEEGPLTGFVVSDIELDTAIVFTFSLGEGEYLSGDTCEIDFVYGARNEVQDPGVGYDDEERLRVRFTTFTTPVVPLFTSLTELSTFLVQENGGSGEDDVPGEDITEETLTESTEPETKGISPEEDTALPTLESVEEVIEEKEIIEEITEPVEEELMVQEESGEEPSIVE